MDLKGKTAIVTGGAIRVGKAIALALAAEGCDVLVHYGRSAGPAQETRAELEALGVRAELFSANLAESDAPQRVMDAALERFGGVDILVNSAAIFPESDTFFDTDAELFSNLMNINLRAPFLLSQVFAKALGKARQGKIINVTDARIFRSQPDHFVYRFTKLSLHAMTEMAPQVLGPNITVNAVALGAILPPPGMDASYLENLAATRVPIRRPGDAEIVAQNVVHLLHQDFINGVTIKLDGGEFLG